MAAPSGSTYAGALIGPIVFDVEVVGGVTCYDAKLPSSGDGHGVVWPFGTVAKGDALFVPGLTEPLIRRHVLGGRRQRRQRFSAWPV